MRTVKLAVCCGGGIFTTSVVTGKTSAKNGEGTPVLIGLPMFTGVGKEEFSKELVKTIHEIVGE